MVERSRALATAAIPPEQSMTWSVTEPLASATSSLSMAMTTSVESSPAGSATEVGVAPACPKLRMKSPVCVTVTLQVREPVSACSRTTEKNRLRSRLKPATACPA